MIEVIWNDHWGSTGWRDQNHAQHADPEPCKTVGYFLGYSKHGDLVLGSTADSGSQVNNVSYRLWNAVTKIRKLK